MPGAMLLHATARALVRRAGRSTPQLAGPGRCARRGLQTGLVGLPNVGKSTLFNAVTRSAQAQAENFPFCTIEPNSGRVVVHDPRLERLQDLFGSAAAVPATLELVDIAGLVEGASEGKGLGNQFLNDVRMVDAIVHVVRCFDDGSITHVDETVDPARDIEVINAELILADLQVCDKRLGARKAKNSAAEAEFLQRAAEQLGGLQPLRDLELTPDELRLCRVFGMLTSKPMVFAANVDIDGLMEGGNAHVAALREAAGAGQEVSMVSASLEAQLGAVEPEEREAMLGDIAGARDHNCDALVRSVFHALGLVTFFTAGPTESRAWPVRRGSTAPEAGGVIHSDFCSKFIKAEATPFETIAELGSLSAARAKGATRIAGKTTLILDGDVCLFHHN